MAIYGIVESRTVLSPSMVRLVFGGSGLDGFEATHFTDQYVNALFVPDEADYSVPFDVDEVRELDAALRPRGRRYTVRSWDGVARELTIDFVVHGDVGFAGRWAAHAAVGDRLQMVGPSGAYRPAPAAEWHLMIGDESALPAIAASLEVLPVDRRCVVIAIADDVSHRVDLPVTPATELIWLDRDGSNGEDAIVDAVARIDWRPGDVDVFVHGEAAEVRALRRFLIAERGVDRAKASISPYWRRGHTDEAWREIKRDWLAEQEADVA